MTALVSIIMPAYNASSYIAEAIDSIISQTYQNWELLIADDGSKDSTRKIIDQYTDNRIKTFHNHENLGYLKTCNKLFSKCAGQYISFQDADDYSSSNRFEKIVNYFEEYEDVSLLGSWSRYFLKGTVRFRECPTEEEELNKVVKRHNPFDGATICVRRVVYDQIGGYKTFFDRIGTEDYDWLLRISEKFKIAVLPEPLYHVRMTPNSITRSITNPMQLISHEIASYCVKERQEFGTDSLMLEKPRAEFSMFIEKKLAPFKADSSLIFRKNAEIDMYNKMYKKAVSSSLKAIFEKPFYIVNYRLLFYVLRKANIKLFI